MFSKIIVDTPWYYFLLSFIAASGIALWLYYKNKKTAEVARNIVVVMFALRFLSLSLIFLFLLNIFFKRLINETENPVILVAVDNSNSMVSSNDSDFVKNDLLTKLDAFKKNLSKKYIVRTILFASKSEASEIKPTFSEKETDIEDLLNTVENNYSNQNIGAIVLVSDGIYNKGANPVYLAEKTGYPLYTLAIGDTTELKDVLIQKINHNQIAYSGNNFPVEVVINAKKYIGKEVNVSLFENNQLKGSQLVKINSDNFLSTCNFTLSASGVGIVRYSAKVSVLEGEKNRTNNIQNFVVEVIDNKEKILFLVANPHPDIAAIKDAITGGTNYEIEYSSAQDFKKNLKAFSLVILHGFGPNQTQIVNECQNALIPFWIINPIVSENLPGIKITGSLNRYNDSEPYLEKSFGLFAMSDEFKKFSQDFPALKTFFGNYNLGNGSNCLINQRIGSIETDNPILYFTEINGLKSAVFLGDGLWKWKFRDFSEHKNHNLFTEMISKSVQYLSVKSDKSFFRVVSPKIINENMEIELAAEVYNKSYEPIIEPDVTLVLSNTEKKKFNYTFSKATNAYKLKIGILPPGEYSYEASVKNNNELFIKKGVFVVKEMINEKINTVANHRLLFQLSQRSKAKLFYPQQLEKLEKELLENEQIKPITYSQITTSSLIDLHWLFWTVLVLLSLEWFFRKRFLSI